MNKCTTKIAASGIVFPNAAALAGEVMAVSNYVDTGNGRQEFQATIASTASDADEVSGIHGVDYTTVNVEPLKPSVLKLVEFIPAPPIRRTWSTRGASPPVSIVIYDLDV